tara:strand:- start:48473 stop:49354 length:882 start_codon:yes stop_codon:yes gene_type:complete
MLYDFLAMNRRTLVCVLLGLPVAALAQEQQAPKPAQHAQQPQPKVTSEQRDEAIELLRRHAEQSKSVQVLVADYVQRRTTTLSKKPLRSSGSFLFVRKPACVVFRASKPRESIVRLTKELYEVFRPRRKRLERFTLEGPDLSRGLFAAVGGDANGLLKDFDVAGLLAGNANSQSVAVGSVPRRSVRLVPKSKAMRERLQELVVTFELAVPVVATDQAPAKVRETKNIERARSSNTASEPATLQVTLCSVAYRDHSGDLVAIELRNARANPKDAPTAQFDVPKGTSVIEHRAGR